MDGGWTGGGTIDAIRIEYSGYIDNIRRTRTNNSSISPQYYHTHINDDSTIFITR